MVFGSGGKNAKDAKNKAGGGKPGGGFGGNKSGGGMGGNKPGMGGNKAGASKPGGFGSKPGAAKSSAGFGAKPGGFGGSKPGSSSSKPGMFGSKPAASSSAKPGGMFGGSKPASSSSSAAKPGGMFGGSKPASSSSSAAKPGMFGGAKSTASAKPGSVSFAAKPGAAKPGGMMGGKPAAGGMMGGKPAAGGMMGGKPAAGMGSKPGAAKPGAMSMGSKPSGFLGAKPGSSAKAAVINKPGVVAKPGDAASKAKLGGGKTTVAGKGAAGLGAKAGAAGAAGARTGGVIRQAVSISNAKDVAKGFAPNASGGKHAGSGGLGGGNRAGNAGLGYDRDDRLLRNASVNGGVVDSQMQSGMSRNIPLSQMDRMDITKMSPRELMMLERQYGAGWLKTLAPTQHMRLQNTIGGTALTSATPTAFSSHMDARMLQAASGMAGAGFVAAQLPNHEEGAELPDLSPDKIMDGSTIAHHPEQLEGLTAHYPLEGAGEGEEERIPSDLMKATTIDGSEAAPTAPPSGPLQGPSGPLPGDPASAPAYGGHQFMENMQLHIGENLYTKNQSYESPEHYQLSTPLLEQQPTFPLYQPHHVSYNPEPLKYNYNDALQNYGTRPTHNDGMYCYSCVMFLGVLMIGIGIICVIVKLFRLFAGTIPLAIIGGCVLLVGILTLAGAMLAWRRKRTAIKKKNAHV